MRGTKKNVFSTLGVSLLTAAFGIAQPVVAATASAYLTDGSGQPVRSGAGGCVDSGSWKESMPTCPEPTLVVEEGRAMIVFAADDSAFFGFDKVKLSDETKADLDSIIDAVEDADLIHAVTITGHADKLGPTPYNERLALRRAQAVKDYLVSRGIPAERIATASDGSSAPLVTCPGIRSENKLIRCLAPNRRVDIEAVLADSVDVATVSLTPPG
ncbi:MAG: OmpA family protein [Chromatiaceae bacterium]|nr:OmpA family protein [Chromatiaceae bacterium]